VNQVIHNLLYYYDVFQMIMIIIILYYASEFPTRFLEQNF